MILHHVPALNAKRIVLASGSPRRRELLANLGLKFEVGPKTLVSWFGHYAALWAFTLSHLLLAPLRGLLPQNYLVQRLLDQIEYGSGSDFRYHQGPEIKVPAQIKAAPAPSLTDGTAAVAEAVAEPVKAEAVAVPEPMGSKRQ
ncbi:hypothetical protein TSOC_003357 [Tetrabaena socialis]|uniref:Septum formation protein Maf n=1 Tax=Tetrabaena socialis TaxID=47790 RepID=A0A2J8ABR8_9CHLO|nr:hypothetical protein TSOC_003357 [Tetrabaena socialis]|eukprot:PNH09972.1 hypothetical protein TSOC_003357 [Tetrabaena socialis]